MIHSRAESNIAPVLISNSCSGSFRLAILENLPKYHRYTIGRSQEAAGPEEDSTLADRTAAETSRVPTIKHSGQMVTELPSNRVNTNPEKFSLYVVELRSGLFLFQLPRFDGGMHITGHWLAWQQNAIEGPLDPRKNADPGKNSDPLASSSARYWITSRRSPSSTRRSIAETSKCSLGRCTVRSVNCPAQGSRP